MQTSSTIGWLKAASAVVIGSGALLVLAAFPETSAPTLLLTDLLLWPLDGARSLAAPETRLYIAVDGAILEGWGVMLWLISARLYEREPELARHMILSSLGVWFVMDCSGSLLAGAPLNVVLNMIFLLAFLVPLWRPARRATV
jgi:hypothetical protein